MSKDGFKILSNRPRIRSVPTVTLDKLYRLYFNVAARRMLGIKLLGWVYILYDKGSHRIGIANSNIVRLVNEIPHRVDKRGYVYAKQLFKKNIDNHGVAARYIYIGKNLGDYVGWHMFEKENYDAVDAIAQKEAVQEWKNRG